MLDNIYKYWHYSNKIITMIMLIIYNPIGTFFVCGFQLRNKKEFILYLFEIPLVDPLTLTTIVSLINPYINITL